MDIEKLIDKDFQGCVSIRKNGEHVFQNAYGYADLANKTENTIDTRFATASAGKAFVAAGILKLVDTGRIAFDDTIGKLIDIDWRDVDTSITVEELLTHTSGIPDYFDESVMEEYEELWADFPNYRISRSEDLLPLFIDKPMIYTRGERFQYNNSGFVVLGLVIEHVTGKPFDVYLKEHVFDKCGMNNTGYYELDRLPAKCANAYIRDEARKEWRTNIYSVDAKGSGAGGAFTTVGDIERFWDDLLGYRLLTEKMTENMLSKHAGSKDDGYYGYGMWLHKKEDGKYVPYFQGMDPGASFLTSYDREEALNITLVSNFGNNVWKLCREIKKILSS